MKGHLVEIDGEKAVLDVGGIGYCLFVGTQFQSKAPPLGEIITLYTHLVTREDATLLFGFITKIERDLFLDVQTVSGIGPKLALAITSNISIADFAQAVLLRDYVTLSKIPGIGKKGAERIALELKDKIAKYTQANSLPGTNKSELVEEAIGALVALGLPKNQASHAVHKSLEIRPDVSDVSLLLQLALSQKKMNKI